MGRGGHYGAIFTAVYDEGAAVGYKWFFERGEGPLFPFGFGLSYTTFALDDLTVSVNGAAVTAGVNVAIPATRPASATPQFYRIRDPSGVNIPLRLVGLGAGSTSSPAKIGK